MTRPRRSTAPPAAKVTSTFTGLLGYVCANAPAAAADKARAARLRYAGKRIVVLLSGTTVGARMVQRFLRQGKDRVPEHPAPIDCPIGLARPAIACDGYRMRILNRSPNRFTVIQSREPPGAAPHGVVLSGAL